MAELPSQTDGSVAVDHEQPIRIGFQNELLADWLAEIADGMIDGRKLNTRAVMQDADREPAP